MPKKLPLKTSAMLLRLNLTACQSTRQWLVEWLKGINPPEFTKDVIWLGHTIHSLHKKTFLRVGGHGTFDDNTSWISITTFLSRQDQGMRRGGGLTYFFTSVHGSFDLPPSTCQYAPRSLKIARLQVSLRIIVHFSLFFSEFWHLFKVVLQLLQ